MVFGPGTHDDRRGRCGTGRAEELEEAAQSSRASVADLCDDETSRESRDSDRERHTQVARQRDAAPIVIQEEGSRKAHDHDTQIDERFRDRRDPWPRRLEARRDCVVRLQSEDLDALIRTHDAGVDPTLHFRAPLIGRFGPALHDSAQWLKLSSSVSGHVYPRREIY